MSWYKNVPKVELHVHLEGAIPHAALFDLIRKYGGDPDIPDVDALSKRFEYKNFPNFIETWNWKNQFLREYEDFSHIAELTARDMAEQKIRYAEVFFTTFQSDTSKIEKELNKSSGFIRNELSSCI